MSMTMSIQNQILEVTVVGFQKLKDTEWFSRQDPFVVLEYNGTKHRTRTCTDGGNNALFQEKFVFTLLQGLRVLKVAVWNSNRVSSDDFIGNATIQLQKVLSQGYDDGTWTLQTKTGGYAGEVRLILHYPGTKIHNHGSAPSAPSTPCAPLVPPYSALPFPSPYPSTPYSIPSLYSQVHYSQPQSTYPPPSSAYPPPPPPPYPPLPSLYYSQGLYPEQHLPPPRVTKANL